MQSTKYLAAAGLAVLLDGARPVAAEPAPSLGAATSFAVLGQSAVTNRGATTVTGNLGVSGGEVSGSPTVELGQIYKNDALTRQAQADSAAVYAALSIRPCTDDLTEQTLAGRTLTPGVYCFSSSAELARTLVLDAQRDPEAIWIFRVAGALTVAPDGSVIMVGGGHDGRVYWQVAGGVTLGENATFVGNILSLTGIVFDSGARLSGRALTRKSAVVLNDNQISLCCSRLVMTPSAVSDGRAGMPYLQGLTASGGVPPYLFTLSSGLLPAGLKLSAEGLISGTPVASGGGPFTITATDARGCAGSAAYAIAVNGAVATEVPALSEWGAFVLCAAIAAAALYALRSLHV